MNLQGEDLVQVPCLVDLFLAKSFKLPHAPFLTHKMNKIPISQRSCIRKDGMIHLCCLIRTNTLYNQHWLNGRFVWYTYDPWEKGMDAATIVLMWLVEIAKSTTHILWFLQGNQIIIAKSYLNCITRSQTDKSNPVLLGVMHMGRQHDSENDTLSG